MFNNNTDKDWEKFGNSEPYWSVLTSNEKFLTSNLTEENKQLFFKTGDLHIESVIKIIKKYIDPKYSIKRALDFGCGVGRLVIPLSKIANNVTGIDVSESMLKETKNNCESRSINNVEIITSDDDLTLLNKKFNFIHSLFVFQHIPVKRGEKIFKNLLKHLEPSGIGVFHFTYAKDYKVKKIIPFIKNYIPLAIYFINLIKKRKIFTPDMQMNTYNVNNLLLTLQKNNINKIHLEFANHGRELGIVVYFKKEH
jgi:2-polyprenyl-3-methyl-5-hydroxy-6-metoxy-1,4-benzoquinol methylase